MEKEKLGQEPAFANNLNSESYIEDGMSKRFYAACAAMQGLLANETAKLLSDEAVAYNAYKLADQLLKQENE